MNERTTTTFTISAALWVNAFEPTEHFDRDHYGLQVLAEDVPAELRAKTRVACRDDVETVTIMGRKRPRVIGEHFVDLQPMFAMAENANIGRDELLTGIPLTIAVATFEISAAILAEATRNGVGASSWTQDGSYTRLSPLAIRVNHRDITARYYHLVSEFFEETRP